MPIGRIERLQLRTVWKHEAHDFTAWLEKNLEVLNDVLDLNLVSARREQSAGAFSVDLVAEDADERTIIIENQLEKSDHDHLGKLLTYMTALGAQAAIWIVAEPRPEHIAVLNRLNTDFSDCSFYLLKVEAIRIGESLPAPLLTLVVGPSEERIELGEIKKDKAQRHLLRREFWTKLLGRPAMKGTSHAGLSPLESSWIGTGSGMRGVTYNYVIWEHEVAAELYIDRGKGLNLENKAIFDALLSQKAAIEATFGGSLEWERLDERQASRIRFSLAKGGWKDSPESWPPIQDEMIAAMGRLEKALAPHIEALRNRRDWEPKPPVPTLAA
jgi:hypothetical protein